MSEPDRELEELQSNLDILFTQSRPRPGFEHDLWQRMQPRPGVWERLRGFFAPAHHGALAGLAALLLVAGGFGFLATRGAGQHGASSATVSGAPGSQGAPAPQARPPDGSQGPQAKASGAAQVPVLHPRPGADTSRPGVAIPYYGAAALTWPASLPGLPSMASAYHFNPAANDSGSLVPSGGGLTLVPANLEAAREPGFVFSGPAPPGTGGPLAEAQASTLASRLLDSFGLRPKWPFLTVVEMRSDGTALVHYQRLFDGRPQIDAHGDRAGLDVELSAAGGLVRVAGPSPLLPSGIPVKLRPLSSALPEALNGRPAPGSQDLSPLPKVSLTRVELVYIAVLGANTASFEPAYLFSGTFQAGGMTYEKRVLVPAVEPGAGAQP